LGFSICGQCRSLKSVSRAIGDSNKRLATKDSLRSLDGFARGRLTEESGFTYSISRISGAASAFSNVIEMDAPFRTLLTRAGLKHAKQIPPLCLTLG